MSRNGITLSNVQRQGSNLQPENHCNMEKETRNVKIYITTVINNYTVDFLRNIDVVKQDNALLIIQNKRNCEPRLRFFSTPRF